MTHDGRVVALASQEPAPFTVDNVGRKLDVDQLVGAQEIADLLGITRQRVHQLRLSPGFPEPVVRMAMGLAWYWPDVEAWARKTGRYPTDKT